MSWSYKSDYTVAYQVALEVICGQSVGIGSRSSLKRVSYSLWAASSLWSEVWKHT